MYLLDEPESLLESRKTQVPGSRMPTPADQRSVTFPQPRIRLLTNHASTSVLLQASAVCFDLARSLTNNALVVGVSCRFDGLLNSSRSSSGAI